MKATELLKGLQSVFLSSQEVVEETVKETVEATVETTEEVTEPIQEELSETTEEVVEETTELAEETTDEPSEDAEPEMIKVEFATKEDLSSLKSEMLEILSTLEEIRKEYKKDVPAELSEQTELSEEVEEISHSPESTVNEVKPIQFSANRKMTTQDRVFAKLFKNN